MTFLEPETELMNLLRNRLTDYNSANRSGKQWVFDDEPRDDLASSSFPRVVTKKISESGRLIGIGDNDTWDDVALQVDVLVHTDTPVISSTETDEALGTISNSPRLFLHYQPDTMTNIKHNTVAFGTVTVVVNEASFTTPASLAAGTVEVCRSTGRLNFGSADLASYSGQSITSTYIRTIEGERLALRIARDVVKAVRLNWRTDTTIGSLRNPEKLDGPRLLPFDRDRGIHHAMVEYKFKRFNTGEEV